MQTKMIDVTMRVALFTLIATVFVGQELPREHAIGALEVVGMQQALDYATTLNIPFVFSSNGDGFVFHDRTGLSAEKESSLTLYQFPTPKQLWSKYAKWKGITPDEEEIVLQDYFDDGSGKPKKQ